MKCLLSSAYAAPVQWYQKLCRYDEVWVENCDSFVKQTYRNRCVIATTSGTQALTIPVGHDGSLLGRDMVMSDHGNWRHLHWQALCSAYGESPFFEYFADGLRKFYERKWESLYRFNYELTITICEMLDISPNLRLTTSYVPANEVEEGTDDFREAIRPKHPLPDADFNPRPYWQVYKQKNGFQPNLSIYDLLFNEGREAVLWLYR